MTLDEALREAHSAETPYEWQPGLCGSGCRICLVAKVAALNEIMIIDDCPRGRINEFIREERDRLRREVQW